MPNFAQLDEKDAPGLRFVPMLCSHAICGRRGDEGS
jgi:hypothetical protein